MPLNRQFCLLSCVLSWRLIELCAKRGRAAEGFFFLARRAKKTLAQRTAPTCLSFVPSLYYRDGHPRPTKTAFPRAQAAARVWPPCQRRRTFPRVHWPSRRSALPLRWRTFPRAQAAARGWPPYQMAAHISTGALAEQTLGHPCKFYFQNIFKTEKITFL